MRKVMTDNMLRADVLACARKLTDTGINRGSAGNVSVRAQQADGFLITPTGLGYHQMTKSDIVAMTMEGSFGGACRPSSEWRMHRDIYAMRPEAGAVIHTHSTFATVLACMDCDVPPFHYMIARFGGADVRCAPYATFGSQELSDHMLLALEGRSACLLAHHGALVVGRDLAQAFALAQELEDLCEQYWRVLQIGKPELLSDEEMQRVLEKFSTYGQQ
jgi:L-fuculose-phosphate aldolase